MMRAMPKSRSGKTILGEMALPVWRGSGLGDMAVWLLATVCAGNMPDYVMIIDEQWWAEASIEQRFALIHHELSHAGIAKDRDGEAKFDDNGDPIWAIFPHDLDEFNTTVKRYGSWSPDIQAFIDALKEGGAI